MKRLLIVDDHAMVRKGLISILELQANGDQVVCDEASGGDEAILLLNQQKYE